MKDVFLYLMIYSGSALMAYNIYRYMCFSRDVRKRGNWDREQKLFYLPIWLLVMFFIGYLVVGFFGKPDLVMAGILFGGSIFVFVMLLLIRRIFDRIQENEQLEAKLSAAEEASKAKTFFLSNMSHDIRTPLNAIIGYTSLAKREGVTGEEKSGYIDRIEMAGRQLLEIVNDVLDMSRIESGKLSLEPACVNLEECVEEACNLVRVQLETKKIEFTESCAVSHKWVMCDRAMLDRALMNMLCNAGKFTEENGRVSLQLRELAGSEEAGSYEIRIKDTGIGMSREFAERLFIPFERERTSTVSRIQGTGLGLAITKNIVDMMGGTITVNSEKGKGSEFIVAITCRVTGEPIKPEPIPELNGLRALIADDDTDTCLSVCSMLREIGMRPDWTNYGKEAVIRAKDALDSADEFKVYIIDWQMPDLNGLETVRRIRNIIGDDTPIFILTAYDWADIEDEALEAGVTAFCSKPLFMSELRNVLAAPFMKKVEKSEETVTADFSGKRVLLAEDNEMNQIIAETILTEVGLMVDIASNGEVAVEKMETHPAGYYDIILMDIQMPMMDGYTAAKLIRKLDDSVKANIPIVAVTANAFEEDRKIALEAGMDGHLAKPYDIPKMMDTLQKLLQ